MLAVDAAARAEQQAHPNAQVLFEALKKLVDNIAHPVLILIGERLDWTNLREPVLFCCLKSSALTGECWSAAFRPVQEHAPSHREHFECNHFNLQSAWAVSLAFLCQRLWSLMHFELKSLRLEPFLSCLLCHGVEAGLTQTR